MPKRSMYTDVVMERIASHKSAMKKAAKAKTPPPFMQESYTPSEYRKKYWGNKAFRDAEIARRGPEELAKMLRKA